MKTLRIIIHFLFTIHDNQLTFYGFNFRFKDKFSKFAHDAMYRATHPIRIPFPATVFDYCLDESTGTFIRWGEKQQDKAKILAGGYTITPDVSFSLIKKL